MSAETTDPPPKTFVIESNVVYFTPSPPLARSRAPSSRPLSSPRVARKGGFLSHSQSTRIDARGPL